MMFYPKLIRKLSYDKNQFGKYYKYSYYREAILDDCKKRCVYCDIVLKEHGFEGMQLDHFRPQDYFKMLTNDPLNLVIACPKCNRLKSNHWPCDKNDPLKPSHDGNVGFLDPFNEDFSKYFEVHEDGILNSLSKPADYLIELLDLNRTSRVLLRRRRMQINKAIEMSEKVQEKLDILVCNLLNDSINKHLAKEKYDLLKKARIEIDSILKFNV